MARKFALTCERCPSVGRDQHVRSRFRSVWDRYLCDDCADELADALEEYGDGALVAEVEALRDELWKVKQQLAETAGDETGGS